MELLKYRGWQPHKHWVRFIDDNRPSASIKSIETVQWYRSSGNRVLDVNALPKADKLTITGRYQMRSGEVKSFEMARGPERDELGTKVAQLLRHCKEHGITVERGTF